MLVLPLTKKSAATAPPKVTAVASRKFWPVISTGVPALPVPGVKLVMLAGKEKSLALITVPLLAVRLIGPVVAEGTVTATDPNAGGENAGVTPLNFIAERPSFRAAPLMVPLPPSEPEPGEKLEMVGWILK